MLTSGLLHGVLIGAVISMLLLIRRASKPHVGFLGRIPGSSRYSDVDRHPDNETVDGVVIFNADHVGDKVLERVRLARPKVHTVVGDLSASPLVDLAGAEMLKLLEKELRALGAGLRIVEVRSSVRDKLREQHVEGLVGSVNRYASVADAVEKALTQHAPESRQSPLA